MDVLADWWKIIAPFIAGGLIIWVIFRKQILNFFDPVRFYANGHVVAVDIATAKHARLKGDPDPMSTRVIVKTTSGEDINLPWYNGLRDVRGPIKKQVFLHGGTLVSEFEPQINHPDPMVRQDAVNQMKNGGYRYWLPNPVETKIYRSNRDRIDLRF